MFDPEVEADGVKDILAALTEEEMKYLSDPNMPLFVIFALKRYVSPKAMLSTST
jgi:hypothetical protein